MVVGGVRRGGGADRRTLRSSGAEMQRKRKSDAHWDEPRVSVRPRDELLGGLSSRNGGVRYRVREDLPQIRLPQFPLFHEGNGCWLHTGYGRRT